MSTATQPPTTLDVSNTRRTPFATGSWLTILKKPASPVCFRWVPPQNSTEFSSVAASGRSVPVVAVSGQSPGPRPRVPSPGALAGG